MDKCAVEAGAKIDGRKALRRRSISWGEELAGARRSRIGRATERRRSARGREMERGRVETEKEQEQERAERGR